MFFVYPMLLYSPFKTDIWGGDKIGRMFTAEEYEKASQIWLLSASAEGESTVKNGVFKDKTIGQVFEEAGRLFGGKKYDTESPFPLFIRLIDAKDNLPLQVCDKERVLYIADAEDKANMIFGFSHNMSDDEIQRRLYSNTLFSACNFLPVKTGDIIKIPPSYMSAVGKGILCYEIGFTEAETYTISDYGRTDINGNRQRINPAIALRHTYTGAAGKAVKPEETFLYPFGTVSELNLADKGHVSLVRLAGSMGISEEDSFLSIIVTSGSAMLSYPSGSMRLKTGDSLLIPAAMKTKLSGYANLLCAHI